MHIIKTLLLVAPCVLSVGASAKTIYSGEFDYRKVEPSSVYFSGRTRAEISKWCKTGEHASTEDLGQCSHMEYENADRDLTKRLKLVRAAIAENDKSLKADGEPLALPYFDKSQDAWAKYREGDCYSETYMLGEASMRYINFWDCMTRITKNRFNDLTRSNQDE